MHERNCRPGFAWAFGMRPENFGFDAGTFWGGRGKSRGGPFGGGRMFDQGHLKFVILRLLDEKPRHGYEIIKEIEDRFGGMYSPSPGTVYPTLTMLEDLGYARARPEESGKKIYEITEEGRAYLAENQPLIDDIFSRDLCIEDINEDTGANQEDQGNPRSRGNRNRRRLSSWRSQCPRAGLLFAVQGARKSSSA